MNIQQVNQIISALTPYAKSGWVEGSRVVQIDGVQSLIYGLVGAVISAIFVWIVVAGIRGCEAEKKENKDYNGDDYGPLLFVIGSVALVFGIFSASYLFDVWTWEGIFNPSLALAHHILEGLK